MKKLLLSLLCCVGVLTAFAEQETVEITQDAFTTGGYDSCNGDKEAITSEGNTFNYYTYKIYKNSNAMQWQKSSAYLYNTSGLGKIDKIEITSSKNNLVVYECSDPYNGTTNNGTEVTYSTDEDGNGAYTFSGNNRYFYIKNSSTAYSLSTSVKIYFKEEEASTEPSISCPTSVDYGYILQGAIPEMKKIQVTISNVSEDTPVTWNLNGGNSFTVTGTLNYQGGELEITPASTANLGKLYEIITITAGTLVKDIEVSGNVVALAGSGDGTEESPYDVARALSILQYGFQTEDNVYIKGDVTAVTEVSTTYGNATYRISDEVPENETEAPTILVFRGKSFNGDNFTTEDGIAVGDKVVVCGKLVNYVSNDVTTPEVTSSTLCYQLRGGGEIEPLKDPELAWSKESATVTLNADDNIFPTLTNTYGVDVAYTSSDTNVATIATDGTITLVAKGTTTITASSDADETYKASSASYQLIVSDGVVASDFVDELTCASFGFTKTSTSYSFATYTDENGITYKVNSAVAADGTDNFKFQFNTNGRNSGLLVTGNTHSYELYKVDFVYDSGKNFGVYKSATAWSGTEGTGSTKGFDSTSYPDTSATADWKTTGTSGTQTIVINESGVKFPAFKPTANGATYIKSFKLYWREDTTGIEGVEADDSDVAPAYYNLQGVRVANPAPGNIYIEVRGTKASKVLF